MAPPLSLSCVPRKHHVVGRGYRQPKASLPVRSFHAESSSRALVSRRERAVPLHLHLSNVKFVVHQGEAARRNGPTELEQWHGWIKSFRATKPWVYWPMIVAFRVVVFLMERVGFGVRLN